MGEVLIINPQTKVGQLLNEYPGLEDVLIAQAPIFAKLRNPVLRRTVARVATLEKAAAMAGILVSSLVSALRKAAGHGNPADYGDPHVSSGDASVSSGPPAWVDTQRITETLDVDEQISRGKHPLNEVFKLAATLAPGELIKLTSSFAPVPLTETLKQQGYDAVIISGETGRYETFIRREKGLTGCEE